MIDTEKVKSALIRRIGDIVKAEQEYFNLYHREFNPEEYIEAAIDDCRGFFGCTDVPVAVTNSTVADIAYIRYQLDTVQGQRIYGLKSSSYTEGSISKSETYMTEQEINISVENILKPYSRFRVVNGHGKPENT